MPPLHYFSINQYHHVDLFWDDYIDGMDALGKGPHLRSPFRSPPTAVNKGPAGEQHVAATAAAAVAAPRPTRASQRATRQQPAGAVDASADEPSDEPSSDPNTSGAQAKRTRGRGSARDRSILQSEQNKLAQKRYRERKKEKVLAMERQAGSSEVCH